MLSSVIKRLMVHRRCLTTKAVDACPVGSLSIVEASQLLREKKITSVALTEACFSNIDKNEDSINAFITITRETALEQARQSDLRNKEGKLLSILDGIPIAIKDNFCSRDIETTAGSKMLQGFVPPYNATVVDKLINGGAVLIGKTNMDEFGMGSGGDNSYFQSTLNPIIKDEKCVPGGSSSGSAAAVAANFCFAAIGSDTGGSVRLPASYCGLVGFKPSYGLVSRFGLIAYGSSLDCPGVISKSVSCASSVLEIISGEDENDSTSISSSFVSSSKVTETPLTIGVPKEYLVRELDDVVTQLWRKTIASLSSFDHISCNSVSLPSTKYALPTYYIIASAEAASNLARYDGIQYGFQSKEKRFPYDATRAEAFGKEVQSRIIAGTFSLMKDSYDNYYAQAHQIREKIIEEFNETFDQGVDVLIVPTTISGAPSIEEWNKSSEVDHYANDVFTVPASLAGSSPFFSILS